MINGLINWLIKQGDSFIMAPIRFVSLWLAGLVSFVMLSCAPVRADTSGGQVICLGRYALCSSAQCQPIAGDKTNVKCDCELPPEGLNIAN